MSSSKGGVGEAVGKIAASMNSARGARDGGSFLLPGDVSALRRMDLGVPAGAFRRLMITFVPERERVGDEAQRR